MKILVIEKSEVCRFILDQCLTSLGHVFHHSSSADEALEFFRSHQIDCVFIDMDFGRERTLDAIKSFRTTHKGEWFPLLAISSEVEDETFANAILAGADAVLPKPLSRSRILMQVIALERIYIGRQNLEVKKDLITANLALLKLSMYDDATGLANRRYFEETLSKEMKLAKRSRRHLTLLLCEIGNTVQPQDAEDTASKNHYINEAAAAIACIPSRPTDFVCRYNGNSFAVILPNTDQEGALNIAEQIKGTVELVLTKITLSESSPQLTFRIGSATHTGQFLTIDEFIHAASQALCVRSMETV
jgi:two-component system, chemotaxis family, response regulator WspR